MDKPSLYAACVKATLERLDYGYIAYLDYLEQKSKRYTQHKCHRCEKYHIWKRKVKKK